MFYFSSKLFFYVLCNNVNIYNINNCNHIDISFCYED